MHSRFGSWIFVTAVVLSCVTLAGADPAHAATLTVNTAEDPPPDAAGRFPADGVCSLRAAIANAVANNNVADADCGPGAPVPGALDVIQISPTLAGTTMALTYATATGIQPLPVISGPDNPLKIVGPTLDPADFVITGSGLVRPFVLGFISIETAGGALELANLTVTGGNGRANAVGVPAFDGAGGAFFLGDGSTLTLDNVDVRDNHVEGRFARGGAVYGVNSTITNNGGAYVGNSAVGERAEGGAVYLQLSSDLVNIDETFVGYAMLMEGNHADARGGAIAVDVQSSNRKVRIDRSLFRENSSAFGGAMYGSEGLLGGGSYYVTDSTFFRNSSVVAGLSNRTRAYFDRSTFVDTGSVSDGLDAIVRNSIITSGTICRNPIGGTRNLISAVDGPHDCSTMMSADDIGDVTGLATELAQNGGPDVQQTFALEPGSNAIDNGHPEYCGTIDARSVPRGLDGDGRPGGPMPGDCDIGAYEYAKFVVNFVAGTSAGGEGDGGVVVQARIKMLDPDL